MMLTLVVVMSQFSTPEELAPQCATMEMTGHEFLDEARRKQRSTFADGTRVTVDFETKEYEIEYGK